MKSALISFILLLGIVTQAQAMNYPGYDNTPTVTFSETLAVPAVFGTPVVGKAVGVSVTGYDISKLRVSGDSLVLTVTTGLIEPFVNGVSMPIYQPMYDTTFVFDRAATYQVYLIKLNGIIALGGSGVIPIRPLPPIDPPVQDPIPLGSFRIYPALSTVPVYPVAHESIVLSLIVGQTVNSACPPSYSGEIAVVESSSIKLSYVEHPNLTMMACLDTIEYGPDFAISKLAAGSYSVYIDDSVFAGSLIVTSPLIINGLVAEMVDPRIDYIRLPTLAGAAVTAVAAPVCTWGVDPLPAETLRTISDAVGQFSLTLPGNGVDFRITVTLAGYHSQSAYTNTYASTRSLPPVKSLSFELMEETVVAQNDLEVLVTRGGAPVDSVSVSLSAGREMAICPLYDNIDAAAGVMATTDFYGTTGQDGKTLFSALSMNPFIDYVYNVSYYRGSTYYYQSGVVRMNHFIKPQTLEIALTPVGTEQNKDEAMAIEGISVLPNPFNPSTEIRFSNPSRKASVTLYDLKGQRIAGFKDITGNSVTWNAANRPSGLYIVKAIVGSKRFVKRVLLQK